MGGAGPSEDVLSKLLAADFDPDDYDKLMSEAFNEEYYEVQRRLLYVIASCPFDLLSSFRSDSAGGALFDS